MDDEKAKMKKIVTRLAPGAWEVKYSWHFRADYMDKYVAALKDKKLLATKCPRCGRVYSPPTAHCGRCFIELDAWTEVKDTGKVIMYTVMFNAISGEPLEEPIITAMIQLDGADAWQLAPIRNTRPEEMRSGLPIRVVWSDERHGKLKDIKHFEAIRD